MKKIISVLTGIMFALSVIMPAAVLAAEENILELGKTVDFTPGTSPQVYYFTPTESNAYRFDGIYNEDVMGMPGQGTASYNIMDMNGNYMEREAFRDSAIQKTFYAFFLKAGVKYKIIIYFSKQCSFTVSSFKIAENIDIYLNGSIANQSYTAYIGVPVYVSKGQQSSPAFLGSVEYTLSNKEVGELDNSNTIKFLKAGETDLTVASETGVSNTVHITVKEPKSLELDSPVSLMQDCTAYSFVPSEDGAYGFNASNYPYNNFFLYHDNQYVSQCKNIRYDNGYVLQCELKAGEKYTVVFDNYLSNVQLNVYKLKEAQKLELYYQFASQPVTEINAEIGGEAILVPSFGGEKYFAENVTVSSNSNESVVAANIIYNEQISLKFNSIGSSILSFKSDNGLTVTLKVTVTDIPVITAGQTLALTYKTGDMMRHSLSFTPDEDGAYVIKATDITGSGTLNVYLMDGQTQLNQGYGSGWQDMKISYPNFEKNKTYLIQYIMYSSNSDCSFNLTVEKSVGISAVEIITPPKNDYIYDNMTPTDFSGLTARISFTNGESQIWSYDIDGNRCNIKDFLLEIFCSKYDGKPYIRIECGGANATYYYDESKILKSPVKAITHAKYDDFTFVNNQGYDYYSKINGECFKVEYNDGSIEYKYLIVGGDGNGLMFYFRDISTGKTDGINIDDNRYNGSGWSVGGKNEIYVTYKGAICTIPVKVIESEVLKIKSIKCNSKLYLPERKDSRYYVDPSTLKGITVDIETENEDETTVDKNIPIDGSYKGYSFRCSYENHWQADGKNSLTVYLGENSFEIEVVLEKNTVEVKKQPQYKYGDINYGRWHYSMSDGDVSYNFYPSLSDGEYEIVITCGENTYTVTSADADSAYFQMLSDIENGTVTAALNYGGKLYDVKLDIICSQTPEVESITVTKAPDTPICGLFTSYIGTKLEIKYTDSEEIKTVTVTKDNIYYNSKLNCFAVDVDGEPVCFDYNSNVVVYKDAALGLEPPKSANKVLNVSIINETANLLGSDIRVRYTDGKEIKEVTVKLNDVTGMFTGNFSGDYDERIGIALTEYGFFNYYLNDIYNPHFDGILEINYEYFLETKAKLISGDVNGDGDVDIRDIVRLKKHFAENADIRKYNTDLTADSEITADDMIELKKYLLGEAVISVIKGDVNCDGVLDDIDVKLFNAYLNEFNMMLPKSADIDNNGIFDREDLTLLEQLRIEAPDY